MITEQNSEVKIFRLNTGEDIIGSCIFDDETCTVMIDNPMKVVVSRTSTVGKTMLIMMPWLPLELIEETLVSINYDDIIVAVNPKKHFIEYYFDTIDKYQASLEKASQEEDMFDDDSDDDGDDMDIDTMQEMLEVIKERKNKSIH